MSRRHGRREHRPTSHGRRDGARNATSQRPVDRPAPDPAVTPTPPAPTDLPPRVPEPTLDIAAVLIQPDDRPTSAGGLAELGSDRNPDAVAAHAALATVVRPEPVADDGGAPIEGTATPGPGPATNGSQGGSTCTAAQFRRFIKSRAYVPMHELRRRFGINGSEDDVWPVAAPGGCVYVGLPERESALLGELFRAGDVGYELSVDPISPVVIGVYPMRPVPRS